nr:UPF0481 protein At3g47200-like isoform X1 [Quercus suber]
MAESTIVEIEQPVGASSNSALIATEGQKKLRSIPPIHKVPANIRKWNEGAYTPSNVSIGPYHCNSNIRREYFSKLNILISECAGRKLGVMDEFDIRHYYRETIDDPNYVTDKLFVRDAYLVIEIFLRLIDDARRIDLLLLENQLPFFFIEELFRREYANTSSSLIELTFDFFKEFNVLNIKPTDLKIEIEHFTDLLRTFYLPPSRQLPKRGRKSIKLLYTATQLQEAGVKIEVSSSKCILDFKFDFKTGRLQIPCLVLTFAYTIVVQNVLALEQTRYVGNGYVTDYFLMMSSLAQSIEDMELLRHLKIVQGFDYKTDDALLSIVQDLCRDIESIDMNHDYILTFKKLKKFHNRPRNLMHMWKKPLKRDYFSNPWRTASTIAAIILLVLTFIQTVCSIIQVLPK